MRISKIVKPFRFVALLVIVNIIMCFLIEPARGSSAMMWEEYYQEKELDTIFVGSSLCSATFDPKVINAGLGVKSMNMGTPMQAIGQNITAVETALEEHDIQTVVIGMGFFILQGEGMKDAELTFERALAREKGGLKGIAESLSYVFSEEVRGTEKSINYWFPWIYDKEEYSLNIMYRNVRSKIGIMKQGGAISDLRGYRPYEGEVTKEEIWKANSYYSNDQAIKADLLEEFEELLKVCRKGEADIIVINTPHPAEDIVTCHETYVENDRIVRDLCGKYDVDYYDFSLVKPEVFSGGLEYYYNYEHLNYEGSQAFCEAFCDFMKQRAKGHEIDSYFYSAEEYLKQHSSLLEEWKVNQVK